ncbi:MAG: hypothetical protein ACP5EK_04610 [Thermoplasmatota archaeon]
MNEESMNDELRQWLAEHGELRDARETEEPHEEPVSGKCTICEARQAKYRCLKCGAAVCPSCYWVLLGLCDRCVSPEVRKRIREARKDYGIDRIK